MTRSDTTTVSAQVDKNLNRRFERAVSEASTSKSSVLREAIQSFVEDIEGDTPASIESKIEELREERKRIEEEKQSLESSLSTTESRIRDLEDQLENLRSRGDVDELREELVDVVTRGGDLRVIHEKTDKVSTYRRLAGIDTVEEAIESVHDAADSAGDGR
jgi:septal ring factor EnvC (AmiA/AmiB activator)